MRCALQKGTVINIPTHYAKCGEKRQQGDYEVDGILFTIKSKKFTSLNFIGPTSNNYLENYLHISVLR